MFQDFKEADNEIRRDLNELGILVHPETMQDKEVKDDIGYLTKELQNYSYTVLRPDQNDVPNIHTEWVNREFEERIAGDLNPGTSWRIRPEVWEEFLEGEPGYLKNYYKGPGQVVAKLPVWMGKFSYTYSERMGGLHVAKIIDELKVHPNSRQLWLPVWYTKDEDRRGKRRVPCSLGYWFVRRGGKLHVTYMMRSCDFITHWPNDVALATMLMQYIAGSADIEPGTFTQFIGSFHVYAKDVEDVF
jgi:thymidylate synthase